MKSTVFIGELLVDGRGKEPLPKPALEVGTLWRSS